VRFRVACVTNHYHHFAPRVARDECFGVAAPAFDNDRFDRVVFSDESAQLVKAYESLFHSR